MRIYQLLMTTALAEALCIVPDQDLDQYCDDYIHDFLKTVHFVSHSNPADEYKVIILSVMRNKPRFFLLMTSVVVCTK